MIVFLHIPKTAGTTFRFILESTFGISNCHTNQTKRESFRQSDLDFAKMFFPRLRAIAGHNLVDPLQLAVGQHPFYMTFMREPVMRAISHYQDWVLRGHIKTGFEECLRKNEDLENLQVKLMAGGRDLDKAKRFLEKCHFVGFTENFDLSLHLLERICPYKLDLNYKRKVVARDNSVKKTLMADSRMMELAREYNKLDIELHRFAVDEIFPRLCEKAGLNPQDKAPSHEIHTGKFRPNYRIGRFYNKIFRVACKFRS